jgi:hypothetical protein
LNVIRGQSQAQLNSETALNPLCKQNQECAGWGANPITGPAKFNIVSLSFTDATKTFEGKREPVEAQVTPVLGPHFAISTETFPHIEDFVTYTNKEFTANNPPQGTNGIYGQSFENVLKSYFTLCGNHPNPKYPQFVRCDSLSVSTASRSIVSMKLPFDPITSKYTFTLNKFTERAIQSLPPPPDLQTNITTWWELHNQIFTSFFDNYGTEVIVQASLGGMVEQYSSFDSVLETNLGKDKLKTDAQIDFSNATGLIGPTGPLDPSYKRSVGPLNCVGGNLLDCNKKGIDDGAWAQSTTKSPALLLYEVTPLTELLDGYDPAIKASLEKGAEIYVELQQLVWKEYYTAYTQCKPPFAYPDDPTHCPAPPTPKPTPAPPPPPAPPSRRRRRRIFGGRR